MNCFDLPRPFTQWTNDDCNRVRGFNSEDASDALVASFDSRCVIDGGASLSINEANRVIRPKFSNCQITVFGNVSSHVGQFIQDLRMIVSQSASNFSSGRSNDAYRHYFQTCSSKRCCGVYKCKLSIFRGGLCLSTYLLGEDCYLFRVRICPFVRRILVCRQYRERICKDRRLINRLCGECFNSRYVRIFYRFRSSRSNASCCNSPKDILINVLFCPIHVFRVTWYRGSLEIGTQR